MKKLVVKIGVFALIVVVICVVTYIQCMQHLNSLFSDGSQTITSGESSYIERKGHVDNPLPCNIKKTYECKIGFTIPIWVPRVGGLECVYEYTNEVIFPGTQNLCVYTANDNQTCFYYQCKKNGT
ncbi:MAG: hypothetical protein E7071_06150 [Bacteroidales bacterium]|nr:hypothetical protein [Bacteroidales bacterium]